jgi:hypothetical protein
LFAISHNIVQPAHLLFYLAELELEKAFDRARQKLFLLWEMVELSAAREARTLSDFGSRGIRIASVY